MKKIKLMYLQVTDGCNLNCPFCFVDRHTNNMTLETALKSINKYNPEMISFHGGEPMLRYELIEEILPHIKPGVFKTITSNLVTDLTERKISLINKLDSISTSYSVDRFKNNQKAFSIFKENCQKINDLMGNLMILVTLSEEQLEQDPKELVETLLSLNAYKIKYERLYSKDFIPGLRERTDEYLFKLFELTPRDKNEMLDSIQKSLKYNMTFEDLTCKDTVITIRPNGEVWSCPHLINKNKFERKKRMECITCGYFNYCKGDCLSFNEYCMFPKKVYSKVAEEMKIKI